MIEAKVIPWVGGEHPFYLYLGEIRALQVATDAGPEELLLRLRSGQWRVDDLTQTLRLGLIGGGMDKVEAQRLVASLMDQHPLLALKPTAIEIMLHVLSGPEVGAPGKLPGADPEPAPQNGTGPESTGPG